MAKFKLELGAELDLLTKDELGSELGHRFDTYLRERYRGVDYVHYTRFPGTSAALVPGPASGYTWSVKLIAVSLAATDTLIVYPGDAPAGPPVGIGAAAATTSGAFGVVLLYGSNELIVKDRNLTLATATGVVINSWRLLAKQVPSEYVGRL